MPHAAFDANEASGPTNNWVYVIGAGNSSVVKIGTTIDVAQRLADIQTANPERLIVRWQTPGSRSLEGQLHVTFRCHRKMGEWFDFGAEDPVTAIRAAVEQITGRPAPAEFVVEASRRRAPSPPRSRPKLDPQRPASGDPDRDNPRYQLQTCGCRELTPSERAAEGHDPNSIVSLETGVTAEGAIPCGGVH